MTAPLRMIEPRDVRKILSRIILADGFELIFDHERSHGAWFTDAVTGREYLDFLTFFASSPIGFNHPKLKQPEFVRTLARVAQTKPSLSDIYTVELARFVDTFRRLAVPAYLTHAFFVEGGALGVENALKTAMDWKVRKNRARGLSGDRGTEIVHLREAFHGRSGYTLSLTNTDPVKTDCYAKFEWPRIENPKLRFPMTPEVVAETAAAEERALGQLRRIFADKGQDVAAVIVEPIQGEGGDNHFQAEFLRGIERLCRENEAFFIVDEVQTGLGLTGKMWAHEHFGLKPDALAFGKKMQLGGCLVGPRVDEIKENVFTVSSRLNSTWGGNLTDMVRATRLLEVIHEERLVENARVVGQRLLDGLNAVQDELGGLMTNARGRGLMIAFDLEGPAARDRAHDALIADGLLVLRCGTRSIRFRPPLNLTAAEADQGIDIVRGSLKRLRGERP
jgi:L-lysine 6-transaminase